MTLRLSLDRTRLRDGELAALIRILREGGVVAYPTDTLYGLAVDPRRSDAVQRLFALKGRPESSALTMIAADIEQARGVAVFEGPAERLAARWWPGPLTIVMAARDGLAHDALSGGTTVGVRVPANDVARALARAFGFCVTATSANRSGEPAATTAEAVVKALPDVDAVIDAGPVPGGQPSTIVAVTDQGMTLLRAGAVPWERVLESLQ